MARERQREKTRQIDFVYFCLDANRGVFGVDVGGENEVGCRRELLLEADRDVFPPNQRAWASSHWRVPLDGGEALQRLCDAWWTTSWR